jgi:DNA-binding transcriptional MerR regulator
LNRYFKNPDLILKKFLNKTKEDNSIKKYQKELIKNSENIETSYEKIAHFIDKVSEENDKKIASIYEKKIEDNKANIKILEERNEKLKELIEANKEVI